ncbi:MAG TPA: xanthine dehydrogenase family protein molybdopterin-binding subunit, partial [Acidimicrobiia bacterium]|nr:xanthine dehydrogenase family protein molybdopterin-binding subunit [Acidimicrobiia bacterium]
MDAVAKVTGQANYAIDASVPDMLFGHVVRAERAHAQILGIDVQAALDVPGVSGVVTAADLEGLFPRYGHIKADHPILAIDKVRFYGEPVALVIADTPHAASDAAEAVRVRYQDLPFVTDPDAALAPDAPLLHDTDYPAGDDSFGEAMSERRTDNIAHEATLEWGDLDAEMA